MKERPILFSGEMVRALLAGTKTQTRRVWKLPRGCQWYAELGGESEGWVIDPGQPWWLHVDEFHCPYGQPGDRLWVRESWAPDPPDIDGWGYATWAGCREGRIAGVPERFRNPRHCVYAASWPHAPMRWTPSIHMPRWASRITLEITAVRVERLQDISEADAQAEGCPIECISPIGDDSGSAIYGPAGYRALWESINGPVSWDANPWVWVVEFKRLS